MGESKPAKSNRNPILIGCGIAASIGVLLCIIGVAVALFWLATSPEGGVRMSNEMEQYALDYIAEHDLLRESEEIIAYYDVTISLNGSEAAILTTERVIYHKEDRTTSIDLKDIDDIEHRYESIIGDVIEIIGKSGTRLKIEIAPLNQGESFHNALLDAWEAAKNES